MEKQIRVTNASGYQEVENFARTVIKLILLTIRASFLQIKLWKNSDKLWYETNHTGQHFDHSPSFIWCKGRKSCSNGQQDKILKHRIRGRNASGINIQVSWEKIKAPLAAFQPFSILNLSMIIYGIVDVDSSRRSKHETLCTINIMY